MTIAVQATRRRPCCFDVTINDSDGNTITIDAGDQIRVKIGRDNSTPLLDLDSIAPSPGGSVVTRTNPSHVTISPDDLGDNIAAGVWDLQVDFWDESQGQQYNADKGLFTLLETMLGETGGA